MDNTTHAQYDKWLPIWTKCRDAIEGQECVHKAGVKYLPMLQGQKHDSYQSYLSRALYFNASGRTLDGMTGLIFRKKPTLVYPTAFEAMLADIDMSGSTFMSFAEQVVDELAKVGRLGILVDYPTTQSIGMTFGQVQALGLRPYATLYKTESILDWRHKSINNVQSLSYVKLSEKIDIETAPNEYESIEQLRVLDLDGGAYRVRVYRKTKDKGEYELFSEAYPLMNNNRLNFIPFIFDSVNGVDSDIKKPVLLDLVNVNLSHYRSTADYEHGLHFTGLPTPIFWGVQFDKGAQFELGSEAGMAFPNPDGRAEFLEFTGQGLGALEKAIDKKEQMMSALGSRMLSAEKRAVEAAETAMIHRSAENSVLSSLAFSASEALTKMLLIMGQWANINGEVTCELNQDFMPQDISPQLFNELTKAYLAGTISYETYFYNLKQGEIIKSDVSIDDERELREAQEPNLSDM